MNTQTMNPRDKVRLRLAHQLLANGGDIARAGSDVTSAMEAEARALGWPDSACQGIRTVVSAMAADMLATAVARAKARRSSD